MPDTSEPGGDRGVEALLLVAVTIWAANYPVAKYGLTGLDVFVFNSIRYVVAAALLVGIFVARFRWVPVTPDDWWKIIGAGFLANVVYQIAFITGLSLTTAGNSAVLLSTSPLWTVFLNARLHRERIARSMWLGMAVSLTGVAMIIVGSGKKLEFGSKALYGDVICLAAAALWGLNTNLQKPLLQRYPAMHLTLLMTAVGAAGLTLVAIPSFARLVWATPHWTYYAAAVSSGLLSIAVAGVFWLEGVKRFGPSRVVNFSNLVPVLAFVISYLLLDEQVFIIQIAGAVVTVFGIWVARR